MVQRRNSRKPAVLKPYNNGKWTEAQFRGWVRSQLRRMSQKWAPIYACKNRAKTDATEDDKSRLGRRIRYVYVCEKCKERVKGSDGAVDHLTPCGSLRDIERDAGTFILRLLVEDDGRLQWLCNTCHDEKTSQERSMARAC